MSICLRSLIALLALGLAVIPAEFSSTASLSNFHLSAASSTVLKGFSADGPAFDRDEFAPGDIYVQALDQDGNPLNVPDGQNLLYFYIITPFDSHELTTRDPSQGADTITNESSGGRFNIPLPSTSSDGLYEVFAGTTDDPSTATDESSPLRPTLRFKVGQADYVPTGVNQYATTAGGALKHRYALALSDGTPLHGRAISVEYREGLGGTDPNPDSNLIYSNFDALVPRLSLVTDRQGEFAFTIDDPPDSPQGTEAGGALAIDSASVGIRRYFIDFDLDRLPQFNILVMGDSYSAGNGAGNYPDSGPNGCYRSSNNYGNQLGRLIQTDVAVESVTRTAACSGAVSRDIYSPSRKHPVPAQIGAVTGREDIIMLTLGGNDVGFAKIVERCFVGFPGARGRDAAKCDDALTTAEVSVTNGGAALRITQALKKISKAANPATTIVLLGYPMLEGDKTYEVVKKKNKNEKEIRVKAGKRVRALQLKADQLQQSIIDEFRDAERYRFISTQPLFNGPPFRGLYAGQQRLNRNSWLVRPGTSRSIDTFYHPTLTGWSQEAILISEQPWIQSVIRRAVERPESQFKSSHSDVHSQVRRVLK